MSAGIPALLGASNRLRVDRLGLWSRIASIVLTTVLILSAVYAFVAAAATSRASLEARSADFLNGCFLEARAALGAEESLERKYRLGPSVAVSAAHRASAEALITAMLAVRAGGNARERVMASDVIDAHTSYLAATRKMFAAVDRRDVKQAIAIDRGTVDPIFNQIARSIDERALTDGVPAQRSLERLSRNQQYLFDVTALLSGLGLLSLGVFLMILGKYQQRIAASYRAELHKLEEAALVDNLTGIGNHRAFQDHFQREASRANRHGESLSLALLDIDDFKVINDRDGHRQGDNVLVELASLIDSLRSEDGAYRIGGDEFAIILPHTLLDDAQESMERLRLSVEASLWGGTVSIGLAALSGSDCDAETLQAQADAALYAAKRSGRNSVAAFDEALAEMWMLSPAKINNLRALINERGVDIVFQPIWDVDGCSVLAYEALSRPRAIFGFSGPQAAFDLAERVGRAHELDAVCREAVLARAHELPASALLFINVSPQALDHGRLDAETFVRAVRAAGLTPDRVVIEITERSITQVEAVIRAARDLQTRGFRLALDDTGAGNSGLEMLSRLPVEFVKIDRDVVVKAQADKNARAVLAGIVAIAQATGAYVIAEGIENAEMLDFACSVGMRTDKSKHCIQGVQGFLLISPSETFLRSPDTDDVKALLTEFALSTDQIKSGYVNV